jgi:peptidoglycan/xylan/chitin deacetylase (PgdA/CDA1 family)
LKLPAAIARARAAAGLPGSPAVLALGALLMTLAPSPLGSGGRRVRPAPAGGAAAAASAIAPGPTLAQYRLSGCSSHGGAAIRGGPRKREVAIGFDDGPAPDTASFVAMLEREHARATFFLVGEHVSSAYGGLLRRELRDGDVLGDHSYTHPNLTLAREVRGQLQHTIDAIRALTGYTPCVFRPPYGAYDQAVLRTARSLGLSTVLWNVDPTDWARPGVLAIERRVLAAVQPGSIIISHDGGGPRGQTLAAYPRIIAGLRARGYRIVTIPELLGYKPEYVPCIKLCDGLGVQRTALPRDAILLRAP